MKRIHNAAATPRDLRAFGPKKYPFIIFLISAVRGKTGAHRGPNVPLGSGQKKSVLSGRIACQLLKSKILDVIPSITTTALSRDTRAWALEVLTERHLVLKENSDVGRDLVTEV